MNVIDLRKTIEPKSDQLNADDLMDATKEITVTDVRLHGSEDQPVSIHYEGDDGRPYKPCKSMRRVLIACWGGQGESWIGKSIRLYADPEVKFGVQKVGGIRISHLTDIGKTRSLMLTITRARRREYTVEPMEAPSRKPLNDELFNEKLPLIKSQIESGTLTAEQAITTFQKHYGEPSKDHRDQIRSIADSVKGSGNEEIS